MTRSDHPSVSIPGRSPPRLTPCTSDPTVVRVRGEQDASTVEALAAELARAIAATDADLSVDLSDVRFMDASTLTVILRAREFVEGRQRSLSIRSPSPCAQRIIDVCKLGELIEPPRLLAAVAPEPRALTA